MSRPIVAFEVIDHGVEAPDYFQGCGVAMTRYEECFTGIGYSADEALSDALDNAACSGWDTDHMDLPSLPIEEDCDGNPLFHHVSLRLA